MLTAKYHPFIFPSFDSIECFFQWIIHNTTQQLFNDILATNKNCWTTLNAHYFACINSLDSSVQLMPEYVYILFERQKTWALIEYAVPKKKHHRKTSNVIALFQVLVTIVDQLCCWQKCVYCIVAVIWLVSRTKKSYTYLLASNVQ